MTRMAREPVPPLLRILFWLGVGFVIGMVVAIATMCAMCYL